MPDFDALFAPESGGPDFDALFAPSTPFRPEVALKNAPKSAFNTAKRIAADLLPGQHTQSAYELGQRGIEGIKDVGRGLQERFGGWENIKRTAENDPVGLAYDAAGLYGGGKGVTSARGAVKDVMPRAVVRDEAELLATGGARMKEAKLNPSKVDVADIQAPMQRFKEHLDENALNVDQYTNGRLQTVIKRLDAAYAPPKVQPEARMTNVQPAAKPPVTLKELHSHRMQLDRVINDTKGPMGQITTDGVIAIELKKAVNEMIDAHPESGSFKVGSNEVHRGKLSQELNEIRTRAARRRTWVNGDEAGALHAETAQWLNKRGNRTKLPPALRAKLEKIGKRDGKAFLGAFGSNTLGGQAFGRGTELALGMWPGTLYLPGQMARQSRNAHVLKEFDDFVAELRAGGPVGK